MRRLVLVTVVILMIGGVTSAHAFAQSGQTVTPIPTVDLDGVITDGGIGSTREDAIDSWGLGGDEPLMQSVDDVQEDVSFIKFNLRATIRFIFQLESDGDFRDEDRLVLLSVTWVSGVDPNDSSQLVDFLLPDDATLIDNGETLPNGDETKSYRSEAIAQIVSDLGLEDGDEAGDDTGTIQVLTVGTQAGAVKRIVISVGDLK